MSNEELLRRLSFLFRTTETVLGSQTTPYTQSAALTVCVALLVGENKLDRFRAVQGLVEAINNPKVAESLELPDWGVPKEEPQTR